MTHPDPRAVANRRLLCHVLPLCLLATACGSGSSGKGPPTGPGGYGPHGPCLGALLDGTSTVAKVSGTLGADGALDLIVYGATPMTMHAQVSRDGARTFSGSITAPGATGTASQTAQITGKVDLQPGAVNKYVISGTFTSGGRTGTVMLRSLDWEILDGLTTLPGNLSDSSFEVQARVAFLDEARGFLAYSGLTEPTADPGQSTVPSDTTLFSTSDGGKSWAKTGKIPGKVNALLTTTSRIWAGSSAGLFSSTDQGASFAPSLALPDAALASLDYTAVVDFFDAQHGVLMSPGLQEAWVTADGGATWRASGPFGGTSGRLTTDWSGATNSVRMLSPTEAVAQIGVGGSFHYLFHTADAGASWQRLLWTAPVDTSSVPNPSSYCAGQISSYSLIEHADARHAWAFSYPACVAVTDDAGATWHLTPAAPAWSTASSFSDSDYRLVAVDANTAWLSRQANETTLYLASTGDRGQTFTAAQLTCHTWGLFPVSATRAFVSCAPTSVAGGATLQVTSDGGATFSAVPGVMGEVAGLRVFADGRGVLLAGGQIFTTADGGASFAPGAILPTGFDQASLPSLEDWWLWTTTGLLHVGQGGVSSELVVLGNPPTELRATTDSLWGKTDNGTWFTLPLAGGANRVVTSAKELWPLSEQQLVATVPRPLVSGSYLPQTTPELSSDGGQTWTPIDGLPDDSHVSTDWQLCAAAAGPMWFDWNGTYYLYAGSSAKPVATNGAWMKSSLGCDANQWWFVDGEPKRLAATGELSVEAVPLEWFANDDRKPQSVLGVPAAASSLPGGAAWLLLQDRRLLHYLDDAAYGKYQGPAVLGTAPTTAPGNHPPVLDPIFGEAHYTYDADGNYLGGTVKLSTRAGDPDGDKVTITWSLAVTSGGPTLSATTGNIVTVILDGFAAGRAIATASDGKGGTATQSFQFSPPPRP
jgi:hypothetical protein